jgi:hypothetical protein
MEIDFRFERVLQFESEGRQFTGVVRIGGISEVDGAFACRFSISVLDNKEREIYGEDPLHALILCLRHISRLIDMVVADGMKIWWLAPGDCGGFSFGNNSGDKPVDGGTDKANG